MRGNRSAGTGEKSLHWSEHRELTAGYWHVRLLLVIFKSLPMLFMRLGAFPVGFSYYLCSKKAREESRRFLLRAAAILGTAERQFPIRILKHILAFSLTVVEKVEAWGGKVDFSRIHFLDDDIGELITNLENGSGALLICSHLGNTELLRGLASFNRTGVSRKLQVTSIVDFSVNPYFNRMLRELNPQSALRVITTDNFGPDTIILLQERLTQGDLVVITGDRTSPNTRYKYFLLPFLNEKAPFGYGPFFLASVLNVPTYFVFALRQKDVSLSSEYNMYVHRSPVSFDCSRKEREQRTRELARSFAEYLERYCKQYPYQWYNFYDFWAKPAGDSEIPPPEQQKRNPVPARPEVQDGSPYSKCGN